MRILLIEDDVATATALADSLREHGHTVDVAHDGESGLELAHRGAYDVAAVDRLLPGREGLDVVRALRAAGHALPILLLTALGETADRVAGLDAGADDYLAKPFVFAELQARLHALARRPQLGAAATTLRVGDLVLDRVTRSVTRGGQAVDLASREFELLEYLMRHAGSIVTRTMLLEHVWGFHFDPKTSVVETHVSRLRGKIDRGFARELLETVRGVGYRLHAD